MLFKKNIVIYVSNDLQITHFEQKSNIFWVSLFYAIIQEAMFEHKVRQNVYEERQNQLRWQVKLGDDQITNSARAQILEERDQSWKEYKVSLRIKIYLQN